MTAALPVDDLIEDLEWLNDTGTGAAEAAKRSGFPTPCALEKWLDRQDRHDLWLDLKRRDPAGTHKSGSDRKKARAMTTTINGHDPIAALLAEAEKSGKARTRNRAAKVAEMVDELRRTLSNEREESRLREAARKDVERLERELAEAKARLKGGSPLSVDVGSGVSAAELREWARDNDVECPPMGRVPQTVREAYEAATA